MALVSGDVTGGCHCGAVRFTARGDFSAAISCNCSICEKRGHLLTFIPAADFSALSGEDELVDYQFNRHIIHHLFCRSCGIQPFARAVSPDGRDMVAVNIRCIDGVDLSAVKVSAYDGRHAA